MADSRLRELERAAAQGDGEAQADLLRERVRVQTLTPDQLDLLAQLEHPPALRALGWERLGFSGAPSESFRMALYKRTGDPVRPGIATLDIPHRLAPWAHSLERWGPEACLRAAVAACRHHFPDWRRRWEEEVRRPYDHWPPFPSLLPEGIRRDRDVSRSGNYFETFVARHAQLVLTVLSLVERTIFMPEKKRWYQFAYANARSDELRRIWGRDRPVLRGVDGTLQDPPPPDPAHGSGPETLAPEFVLYLAEYANRADRLDQAGRARSNYFQATVEASAHGLLVTDTQPCGHFVRRSRPCRGKAGGDDCPHEWVDGFDGECRGSVTETVHCGLRPWEHEGQEHEHQPLVDERAFCRHVQKIEGDVQAAVRAELVPWILGECDPVRMRVPYRQPIYDTERIEHEEAGAEA